MIWDLREVGSNSDIYCSDTRGLYKPVCWFMSRNVVLLFVGFGVTLAIIAYRVVRFHRGRV